MSLDQNDNIIVGAGTGGSTQGANVATDYNSSTESHYQLFKQAFGKDGSFTAVGDGSDAGSRPLPTKLFQDNGIALSAQALTASLSVLNVNLRGTSGSGNVPVDINAQTLGVIRVEGKTGGGTPMGVCGDNFQIRTLFSATAGNTLSVFGFTTGNDSVTVQGMSGGHAVGITVDSPLDIRALTSADQITVAGGTVDAVLSAGITLNAGGTLEILSASGVTGFGGGTGQNLGTAPGTTLGLPVLMYGASGAHPIAIGMSGDAIKVALQQTISASVDSLTVDVTNPKAAGYTMGDTSVLAQPTLAAGDVLGNTLGFPALMYGSCGGTAVGIAVSGGALVTTLQGTLNASISTVNVDVPKAPGYTAHPEPGGTAGTMELASGDVGGNTLGTPALLYASKGYTAVALGTTGVGSHEHGLLIGGIVGVTNAFGTALEITSGANPIAVKVTTLPTVTVGNVTNTVVVRAEGRGITLSGGTLDSILRTVTVVGEGFTLAGGILDSATVVGGVTGFGIGNGPGLNLAPGVTQGLPVFLYGNSGGTAAAVGMSGDGIKVFHESPIHVAGISADVTVVGGVTGFGASLGDAPGSTLAIPTLLYGASAGGAPIGADMTPVPIGVSGDGGMNVHVLSGVNVDVTGIEIPSTVSVENKTNTFLQVGLTGDTLVFAGATFHDGTALNVNTHFFGLTGGLHNSFGLTAGGTYGSSIQVCGTGGSTFPVQTQDKFLTDYLGGFTNEILAALYPDPVSGSFDPASPGTNMNDRLSEVLLFLDGTNTLPVNLASGFATSTQFGAAFGIGGGENAVPVLITHAAEENSTGVVGSGAARSSLNVDVQSIRLPDLPAGSDDLLNGNTAGVLPSSIADTEEVAVQLPTHNLTKGVSIKNTSGTGIVHVGFGVASEINTASATSTASYQLLSREEVFLETQNLNNIWVASCPGASGCYIGG